MVAIRCVGIVILLLCSGTYSVCPPLPAAGDGTALKNAHLLSEECFCSALAQRNVAAGMPELKAYCTAHGVSDTLLFCAFRTPHLRTNESLFSYIVHIWKSQHPSPVAIVQEYLQRGRVREADTLCTILDIAGNAEPALLMRWIDVKKVLDDLEPIPGMFCRILSERAGLLPLATNQLTLLVSEIEAPQAVALLDAFSACVNPVSPSDSSEVLMWLLEQFGEKKAFSAQIQAVQRLEPTSGNRSELLRLIALRYSELGYADASIPVAQAAYTAAKSSSQKKECAALLFREYSAIGKSDSAKVWFGRSGGAGQSVETRFGAVAMYQTTGALDSAEKYLAALPASLSRDTLHIRQLLLRDSVQKAYTEVCSLQILPAGFSGTLVWKVRCALFAKRFDVATELCGTTQPHRTACAPAEVTAYRYWLLRLMEDPEELAKFSQIEYTMFKGNRRKASAVACSSQGSGKNGWRLVLYVAEQQMSQSEASDALKTLRCAPADDEPEYLVALAQANYLVGETGAARTTAQKVITGFPLSPYVAKARLLLVRLQKRSVAEE